MRNLSAIFFILGILSGCRSTLDFTSNTDGPIAPLIDREVFFEAPVYTHAQISPDGQFISFQKKSNGIKNIWVKRRNEPLESSWPLTADTILSVSDYYWSRDSQYILYTKDITSDGNYNVYAVKPEEPDSLHSIPPSENLTNLKGVRTQIYAVPRYDPGYIIIGLNERDHQHHDVYRLNLKTGNKELLIQNNQNISGWVIDESGNIRHAVRQTSDGGSEILELSGSNLERIYKVEADESFKIIRYHKDYERFFMITNKNSNLSRLVLYNPNNGEELLIDDDPEGKVDFGGAIFSDVTQDLMATYYFDERLRIYPKDDGFKKDLKNIINSTGEAHINIGSQTDDDDIWLIHANKDTDPGSVYLYYRKTGKMELLYKTHPSLISEHLTSMHPIEYSARDGMKIPAYLTLPGGIKPNNLPLVVYPHDGPWSRDYWEYDPIVQFLANRGYAVLQPNFRGSTGYGKNFLNSGNKKWGTGSLQHDITDGVNFLIEEGIADPDRVGIFGISYGGYAALAGLSFTPDLYATGVSVGGPSNIISLINAIPAYWEPLRQMFDERVGDLETPEEVEALKNQSPFHSADQIKAPLLIIQDANDTRALKAETDKLVADLYDKGNIVEYIVAEDAGHNYSDHKTRLAYIAGTERFLSEHLGGRLQKHLSDELEQRLEEIKIDVYSVSNPDDSDLILREALTGPLPPVSGNKLKSSKLGYVSLLENQGQSLEMDVTRKLIKANLNGEPIWRLIEHAIMPQGEIIDTIDVRRDNLLPVRRNTQQGSTTLNLNYSSSKIDGIITLSGQSTPLSANLHAPVYADGSGLHLTISSMPLQVNYRTTFRIYDVMSLEVKPMAMEVTDIETIVVPAGTFTAYKIELTPMDDETGNQTIWITNDDDRKLIRIMAILPDELGGGSIVTELISE
ncbi:MAG: alpha/beta fold hydrolase [Balneolales bacterium]